MNNAHISLQEDFPEQESTRKEKLNSEEARLVRIIEAIQELSTSKAWSSLKTEIFDSLVNVLERDLRSEARKESPDPLKLNRISGELKWAEKFSDLQKFEQTYRVQLQSVRITLYGKPE